MVRGRHGIQVVGDRRGAIAYPNIWVLDPEDFAASIARDGVLGFGESFLKGSWRGGAGRTDLELSEEFDEIADWLTVYAGRLGAKDSRTPPFIERLRRSLSPVSRDNTLEGSVENVSSHYDLPVEFFELFLDGSLTYSAGDFEASDDLGLAQMAKLDRILDLARVGKGSHLLDIGCGWGSLLIRAGVDRGAQAMGLTVSNSQAEEVRRRIAEQGLGGRVSVLQEDYRIHDGVYDSIASVEMIEAVGARHWATYFKKIDALLSESGSFALQMIAFPDSRMHEALGNYSWTDRYIFPGGELPSVDEVARLLLMHTRLEIKETRTLSSGYASTLRAWRHRFSSRVDSIRAQGHDDRFIRLWCLYFAYFEAGFRARYLNVYQLRIARRTDEL